MLNNNNNNNKSKIDYLTSGIQCDELKATCDKALKLLREKGDNCVSILIDHRGIHLMRDVVYIPDKYMKK